MAMESLNSISMDVGFKRYGIRAVQIQIARQSYANFHAGEEKSIRHCARSKKQFKAFP